MRGLTPREAEALREECTPDDAGAEQLTDDERSVYQGLMRRGLLVEREQWIASIDDPTMEDLYGFYTTTATGKLMLRIYDILHAGAP